MRVLYSVLLWTLAFSTSQVWGIRSMTDDVVNRNQTTFPMVIVKDYNVYMVDETGKETQLSTTGSEKTFFAPDKIYKSQNNTHAVVYQYLDYGENRTLTLVESSPEDQLQPKVRVIEYEKPGDAMAVIRPRLFDLVEKKEIIIGKDFIDNAYAIEDAVWYFRDGNYRFMYYGRGYKVARMIEINMKGEARVLVEETSDTFINVIDNMAWGFMDQTDEMWWLSDRDGWTHIYLVNTTLGHSDPGSIKQVTKGEFEVYDVVRVDEEEQVMYMKGFSMVKDGDPYHKHWARVHYNGTGFKVLTADVDAYHRINFISDNNYTFEDRWSRIPDLPIQGALRDAEGNRIGEIKLTEEDKMVLTNLRMPERFHAPGRDGKTQIYGNIIKPKNFSKEKKYRVIEFNYPGPWESFVPAELEIGSQYALLGFQDMADKYNVVHVMSSGMGTWFRGKKFRDVGYKNWQDFGFPDRIAWIKAAAAERPWMDLTGGVGIYGFSAGGQTSMAALIWHSDFYSAALSDSGIHDNRLDKLWFNERAMGWPVDHAVYDAGSNVVHANETSGQVLLLVGELDVNVDPANTLQLAHALDKAGKDYEMVLVPGAVHSIEFDEIVSLQNKIERFWRNWLQTTGKGSSG